MIYGRSYMIRNFKVIKPINCTYFLIEDQEGLLGQAEAQKEKYFKVPHVFCFCFFFWTEEVSLGYSGKGNIIKEQEEVLYQTLEPVSSCKVSTLKRTCQRATRENGVIS